jgi:hypothetical protein
MSEPDTEPTTEPTEPDDEWRQDTPVLYVNNNDLSAGSVDVQLRLGVRTGVGLKEQVVAIFTWEQVKILRRMIDQAITEYEAGVGPIRDLTPRKQDAEPAAPQAEVEVDRPAAG